MPPPQLNAFSVYHSDRHISHTVTTEVSKSRSGRRVLVRTCLIIMLAAAVVSTVIFLPLGNKDNNGSVSKQHSTSQAQPNQQEAPPERQQHFSQLSLSDPASLWVVVNKQRPLQPKAYIPAKLTVPDVPLRANITSDEKQVSAVMAVPLKAMFVAAKQAGAQLNLQSGYRSYNFQVQLYDHYVGQQGKAAADEFSARPGFSEHQTGLAVDIGSPSAAACQVSECFGSTEAGRWLDTNAYKYGFIIRYPKGKQAVTGYIYEPWHLRYVGVELAAKMHKSNIPTLEEYFQLAAAPRYN